jgi:hypothetical protein
MNKSKVAPFESFVSTQSDMLVKKIQDFIDGKIVAVTMAVVTVWVLFGDDIRLVSTNKSADEGFEVSFLICLVLFILEIIANSIFISDYKFTFFFWLDVIATISLLPDISSIRDPFFSLFGVNLYNVDVTYLTSSVRNTLKESYQSRAIQTIRYIRLVRIVKLYKYFIKKNKDDPKNYNNPNNMDAEILGKKLSDITTRRVIIGVLALLLLLPLLQVVTVDNGKYYGLQQLYWVGSSASYNNQTGASDISNQIITPYMNSDGWNHIIVRYSRNTETLEGTGPKYPLLWLYVPNLLNEGLFQNITSATDPVTGVTWNSDPKCSGLTVPDDCDYRNEEMETVVYGPAVCNTKSCTNVIAFARFNMQDFSKEQSQMSIIITIFVSFILASASVTFTRDTQNIVIKPVNKMIQIIRNLAKNPLKVSEDLVKNSSKESILEETIDKIGSLLKMNFGLRGSNIMNSLLSDTDINFNIEGKKNNFVICIVKIQNSPSIIDSLQEEVLVFINKIARIVHTCSTRWEGNICKNDMGSFLVIWPDYKSTEALFAMIKTSAELHRATDIMAYKSNPKIVTKFGDNYIVDIQIGLHIGEIIEGPIGSNIKVMPDYISSSVSLAKKIQSLNSFYLTNLLTTDLFFNSLSPEAQKLCRKIDSVMVPASLEPFDLYTFDLSEVSLPDFKRMNMKDDEYKLENRKLGDPIIIGMANMECEVYQLFGVDNDILGMQKSIPSYFNGLFNSGLESYKKGSWQESVQFIEQALGLKPQDGPCLCLKNFMEKTNFKPPDNWQGYRLLE